jgi:hypothetical protein
MQKPGVFIHGLKNRVPKKAWQPVKQFSAGDKRLRQIFFAYAKASWPA